MNPPVPTIVLEAKRFTNREILGQINEIRPGGVTPRTLRRWKKDLGIESDDSGTYTEHEVQILLELSVWTARGLSIQGFAQQLLRAMNENA